MSIGFTQNFSLRGNDVFGDFGMNEPRGSHCNLALTHLTTSTLDLQNIAQILSSDGDIFDLKICHAPIYKIVPTLVVVNFDAAVLT